MAVNEIRIQDEALVRRIERIGAGRKDKTASKTTRDLLHERILELETNGDPSAIDDEPVEADKSKSSAP